MIIDDAGVAAGDLLFFTPTFPATILAGFLFSVADSRAPK